MLSSRLYAWVIAVYFVSRHSKCTSPPTRTVAEQLHHDHHNVLSLEDMAREAATSDPAVIFTMGYHAFLINTLPVLLASLAATDPAEMLGHRLIVGVGSEADLLLCQQVHHARRCWLDDKLTVHHEPAPERDSWQPRRLISTGWRKLEIVQHLVGLGLGVFAADIDLIFLRNPFSLLQQPAFSQQEFLVQCETGDETGDWTIESGHVNIGFYYIAPTETSKHLLTNWLVVKLKWDQGALKDILKNRDVPALNWKPLPTQCAYSLCHVGDLHTPSDSDYLQSLVPFLGSSSAFASATVMHFPCCSYPTPESCKSVMMSTALTTKLELMK